MENKLSNPIEFFNILDDKMKFNLRYQGILCDIAYGVINYRLKNNISQKEFANKLKISKRKLVKIENAEYDIKLNLLFKILNEINMEIKIISIKGDSDETINV
jgi:DNA-binding XRE family transcriptional regulator